MKKFFSRLLANARNRRSKGFTLIELLIVIGILGIIVVAVLLTLNPAEAQRRTRDADRLKDLSELQSAVDQYVNNPATVLAAVAEVTSGGGTTGCAATANWTTLNLCAYLTRVQIDPVNHATATRSIAGDTGVNSCPKSPRLDGLTVYKFKMAANGEYEINVRQESDSNCNALTKDGGNSNQWVEAGTDPGLDLMAE